MSSPIHTLDENMRTADVDTNGIRWHRIDEAPFRVSGLAWYDTEKRFRRMPLTPSPGIPSAVRSLSDCTSGAQLQFHTESARVAVRVALAAPAGMDHMPSTGQCGLDCYIGEVGSMRFAGVTRIPYGASNYEVPVLTASARERRRITLNFPLYQGVKSIAIGIEDGTRIEAPKAYTVDGRIIVYGTSITQGGCAARPGMCYTNILSRRIDAEFINLGFSGNGRGEREVADVIAQIERPRLFVLDYEANCVSAELYRTTLPAFIGTLRAKHPATPILVISRIRYAHENISPTRDRDERLVFQRTLVEELRTHGDANIHFLDGSPLLGDDFDECTVDGVHPTDLGFLRMADGIEPSLRRILA
ncbi:MAG: SGNH/GDSL hydrolase family protein [Spirochaetota bacterium]